MNQLRDWQRGNQRSEFWANNMGETGSFKHDVDGGLNENIYGTGSYKIPDIAECRSNLQTFFSNFKLKFLKFFLLIHKELVIKLFNHSGRKKKILRKGYCRICLFTQRPRDLTK